MDISPTLDTGKLVLKCICYHDVLKPITQYYNIKHILISTCHSLFVVIKALLLVWLKAPFNINQSPSA